MNTLLGSSASGSFDAPAIGHDQTARGLHLATKVVIGAMLILVLAVGGTGVLAVASSVRALRAQAEDSGRAAAVSALSGVTRLREPSAANVAATLDISLDDQLRAAAAATAMLVEAAEVAGRGPAYIDDALAQLAARSPIRRIDVVSPDDVVYSGAVRRLPLAAVEPSIGGLLAVEPTGLTLSVPARQDADGLVKAAAAQATHRALVVRVEYVVDAVSASAAWLSPEGGPVQDLADGQVLGVAQLLAHGVELAREASWSPAQITDRLRAIVANTAVECIDLHTVDGRTLYSVVNPLFADVPCAFESVHVPGRQNAVLAPGFYDDRRRWISGAAADRGGGGLGVGVALSTRAGPGSFVDTGWQAEVDALAEAGDVLGAWAVEITAGSGAPRLAAAAPRPGVGLNGRVDGWTRWGARHEAVVAGLSAGSSSAGRLSAPGAVSTTVVSAAYAPALDGSASVVVLETGADHIAEQIDQAVRAGFAAGAGFLFLTALLSVAFVRYWVTSPLGRLAEAMVSLAGGKPPQGLPARLLRRGDELGTLGRLFESMAAQVLAKRDELAAMVREKTVSLRQVNDRLTKAHQRMEHDVGLARRVQHALVPTGTQRIGGIEFASCMTPAGDLGGDFVVVTPQDGGRVLAAVCDVSGKGVAAALFMACSQGALAAASGLHSGLGDMVADLNDRLCHGNDSRMFVTGAFFLVDTASGSVEYLCAGHEAPILVDTSGGLGKLAPSESLALGILPGQAYPVSTYRLEPGETVVVYTDGVTDAANPDGLLFGEDRLRGLVRDAFAEAAASGGASSGLVPPATLVELVWSSVADFSGPVPPTDDKTLLVVRRSPRS